MFVNIRQQQNDFKETFCNTNKYIKHDEEIYYRKNSLLEKSMFTA